MAYLVEVEIIVKTRNGGVTESFVSVFEQERLVDEPGRCYVSADAAETAADKALELAVNRARRGFRALVAGDAPESG